MERVEDMFHLLKYTQKGEVIFLLLLNLLYAGVLVYVPVVNQKLIDSLTLNPFGQISLYLFYLLVLFVLGQVLMYLMDIYSGKCERTSYLNIINQTFHRCRNYDPKTTSENSVEHELGQNYQIIKPYIFKYPIELLSQILLEVGILIMLFKYSWVNGLVVMIFVPLFILISSRYSEKLGQNGEQVNESIKDIRTYLDGVEEVSFSERFRHASYFQPFSSLTKKYVILQKKKVKKEAFFANVLSYALLNFLIFVTTVICVIQVQHQVITIGTLFAVNLYVSKFWGPMDFLIGYYKEYASDKKIIQEFSEFIETKTNEYESSKIEEIKLQDYVSLNQDGNPLNEPLNCSFQKGKITIIKGDNGCGKTTLVQAILGLTERYRGIIQLPEYGKNSNFMYSIAQPLMNPFSKANVVQTKMSMGQYKLAQLKTDFAEEKDVYLFDEPTNYLDVSKKQTVVEKLEALRKENKIVIVVTHDTDLLKLSDQIINMKAL